MLYYEGEGDACMRLRESIIRTQDGAPVLVESISEMQDGDFLIEWRDDTHAGNGMLYADEFNLRPIELGYMHDGGALLYFQRKPARKYKQGLSKYNCTNPEMFGTTKMFRCIRGEYPTLEVAKQILTEVDIPLALHRRLAVSVRGRTRFDLHFRGEEVGTIGRKLEGMRLRKGYEFYREEIEQVLGEIA